MGKGPSRHVHACRPSPACHGCCLARRPLRRTACGPRWARPASAIHARKPDVPDCMETSTLRDHAHPGSRQPADRTADPPELSSAHVAMSQSTGRAVPAQGRTMSSAHVVSRHGQKRCYLTVFAECAADFGTCKTLSAFCAAALSGAPAEPAAFIGPKPRNCSTRFPGKGHMRRKHCCTERR